VFSLHAGGITVCFVYNRLRSIDIASDLRGCRKRTTRVSDQAEGGNSGRGDGRDAHVASNDGVGHGGDAGLCKDDEVAGSFKANDNLSIVAALTRAAADTNKRFNFMLDLEGL
jgi:hypothetical protein